MNYYERHLGDYSKNCAHLSLLEHGVYVRLLDVYYTREAPIPEDKAARLIGAATPETLQALQVVLEEFFELRDGHWHQSRCDADIAEFRKGEPEREVKKANEDNRLKRHREERAELFRILTDRGEHAPWNIGIEQLRARVAGVAGPGPETPPATQPATAPATPATATHTQTPLPNTQRIEERALDAGGNPNIPALAPVPATAGGLACKAIKAAGVVDVNPSHPDLLRLLAAGVTPQFLADIAAEGATKGRAKFAWVLATAEGRLRDGAAAGAVPAAGARKAKGDRIAEHNADVVRRFEERKTP